MGRQQTRRVVKEQARKKSVTEYILVVHRDLGTYCSDEGSVQEWPLKKVQRIDIGGERLAAVGTGPLHMQELVHTCPKDAKKIKDRGGGGDATEERRQDAEITT